MDGSTLVKDRIGDSATMQAGTYCERRAGLETDDAEADSPQVRGRPLAVQEADDMCTGLFSPG